MFLPICNLKFEKEFGTSEKIAVIIQIFNECVFTIL